MRREKKTTNSMHLLKNESNLEFSNFRVSSLERVIYTLNRLLWCFEIATQTNTECFQIKRRRRRRTKKRREKKQHTTHFKLCVDAYTSDEKIRDERQLTHSHTFSTLGDAVVWYDDDEVIQTLFIVNHNIIHSALLLSH